MSGWDAERLAAAAGADLVRAPRHHHSRDAPPRAVVDSRGVGPEDLFVGIPGTHVDGGSFAGEALQAGAAAVLVTREHAAVGEEVDADGAVLCAPDPVAALGALARAWRRELGCRVVGVTGSTGKTSTKEILAAILRPAKRTHANRANLNTEVGLPMAVLEAPPDTEVLVLELAMRGAGQIADLAAICEPDVGVVLNIGPVHLELLGTIEGVAAAKAELIAALPSGGTAVVPAGETLLDVHHRGDLEWVTFGGDGDFRLAAPPEGHRLIVDAAGRRVELEVSFTEAYHHANLLAAVAAAGAVGVTPAGRLDVNFGSLRGERIEVPGGPTIVNDCYNANPMSMRAALDELAATDPRDAGRRVAVLGDMLELGADERRWHEEVGRYAAERGVTLLVTVGPRAAAMAEPFGGEAHAVADAGEAAALAGELLGPGDVVLVKASRGVGLEVVAEALSGPVGT